MRSAGARTGSGTGTGAGWCTQRHLDGHQQADGDGRADLVVRTYRGETWDEIAVYPGMKGATVTAKPTVTFSTSEFL